MKKWFRFLILISLIVAVCLPVFANVSDETGMLSGDQVQTLDDYSRRITNQYDIGVYIMVVDDYHRYAKDPYMEIFDATATWYHNSNLGHGEGRDGILLMVDLTNREAAFFVYGQRAEYALDDYGQLLLEEAFLDDFGMDDWYLGLMDFLETCEEAFSAAAAGEPIRESDAPMYAIVWLIAAVIAGVVCIVFYSGMKTANRQTMAVAYMDEAGLSQVRHYDFFTHRTVTRVKKEQSSGSSGGRSHSGYGGSGRSSRF